MAAKFVAEEGDLKGLTLSLDDGDQWIIGRDPEACQIVIEDPQVSRKHLKAQRTPQGISIENLSETNPAQINDETLTDSRLLQNGDTVRIGNEFFRYYTDSSAHVVNPNDNNGEAENVANDSPSTSEETTESPHTPDNASMPINTPLSASEQPSDLEPTDPETSSGAEEPVEHDTAEDSIYTEEHLKAASPIAEINFGIPEIGRWLLKVVGGPNNGAEFQMQTGHSYLLGTDQHACDIVFHDTSVSRQHARLSISEEDQLTIEDLNSRNGVLVSGEPIHKAQSLTPSVIVTIGTTSFVVYDREGEIQTIISPLLPSIVKVLQREETPASEPIATPAVVEPVAAPVVEPPAKFPLSTHNIILLSVVGGLFLLAGIGTWTLFKGEPVTTATQENPTQHIDQALAAFPSIKYSFNKGTGSLLLLGHVVSAADKSQLTYNLQSLKFIKFIDDSSIIIDEFVWQEINSILARNPAWKGITVHSPSAGQFIMTGYLQTRKQAEQLADYMSVNFPYLDLLETKVIVEEDVINQANLLLQDKGLRGITVQLSNGDMSLSGKIPQTQSADLDKVLEQIKTIPGVRTVRSLVSTSATEQGIINISDRYLVTGQSRLGDKYTVVINGYILSEGDALDGMTITSIKSNMILLEKDGNKYRIDYNR